MDELKTLLGKVAPWLAAAAAGPAGLAGMAIKTAAEALGAGGETVADVTAALVGAKPEQLQALRTAELDFKVRMQTLGFENAQVLERISADDRKDARDMQRTTRSRMPAVLSVIVVVGFLGLLTGMMLGAFKVSDSQAMLLMLGTLGAAFGAVMQFWFGTTNDSGRKTDMLAASPPLKAAG